MTAFTLAHSVTLSLAVLDVVALPARLVETFVALSIVYVAAENFWVRDLRRRWWLAGLFGLVHGFGFASVLREYGLPRDALLPALAAFNAGVELGQIAVVLAVISAFAALRVGGPRREPNRRFMLGVSGAILAAGPLLERTSAARHPLARGTGVPLAVRDAPKWGGANVFSTLFVDKPAHLGPIFAGVRCNTNNNDVPAWPVHNMRESRMKSRITAVLAAVAAATLAAPVWADTTDVKTQSWVHVKKTGAHCKDDPNCMNRYHPAIKPVARAQPGQLIVFETRDALDSELNVSSQGKDLAAVDLNLVHPLTGPVYIEGAKRGDVLAITLVDIDPDEYGYTTIMPGFGFLRDLLPRALHRQLEAEPHGSGVRPGAGRGDSHEWLHGNGGGAARLSGGRRLGRARSTAGQAGGFALPPQPTGARPAEVCGPNGSHKDKCLRTIPPRENGGNMDVKQMVVGTTLLLPCYVDGCGLFVGDVHYAQGDGEVAGTAIEMGAKITVRTEIRKGMVAMISGGPHFEGGSQTQEARARPVPCPVGYPLKKAGDPPP